MISLALKRRHRTLMRRNAPPIREQVLERSLVGGMVLTMAAIVVPQLAPAAEEDPRAAQIAATLSDLRSKIEQYRTESRDLLYPDLLQLGWEPLIQRRLLQAPPINPLNGRSDIAGAASAGAGWHYDPVTGTIGACYFDEGTESPSPDRP